MSKVRIDSPEMFDTVGFEFTVCGKVTPAKLPVQVYVQAADNKWYLQREVEKHGGHWAVSCHFGDETGTIGAAYAVVALLTEDRPTTPLETLPDVKTSDVILVFRQ